MTGFNTWPETSGCLGSARVKALFCPQLRSNCASQLPSPSHYVKAASQQISEEVILHWTFVSQSC